MSDDKYRPAALDDVLGELLFDLATEQLLGWIVKFGQHALDDLYGLHHGDDVQRCGTAYSQVGLDGSDVINQQFGRHLAERTGGDHGAEHDRLVVVRLILVVRAYRESACR